MERILRAREVLEVVGFSRATLWRRVKAGEFPAPIRLGSRAVGWYQREIDEWLASRPRAIEPTTSA